MTLTEADNAINMHGVVTRAGPEQLLFHWDRRFAKFSITPKCRHEANPVQRFEFALGPLLKLVGVLPEELRALADDMPNDRPGPSEITTDDICLQGMPEDLTGKTVLDVGGYDGRYAAEALRRGAKRAICLDSHQWKSYGWPRPPALPGVKYIRSGLMDWQEPVDVVLFYNVLYHLEDPHAALRHLRNITREQMVLCTMFIWSDLPVWRVYEPREVNPTDETVYWAPSPKGLLRSLKVCGWTSVEEVARAQERVVVRCMKEA